MSIWYFAGFFTGIALVALAVWLISHSRKKRGSAAPKYDERQILARGSAYRAAFFVLLGYLALEGILDTLEIRFADGWAGSFIGICLAAAVFACCCIANDAYLSIMEKPRETIILLAVLTVVNGVIGGIELARYGFLTDGVITTRSMNLICAVMSLTILFAVLLRLRREKAQEEAIE